MLRLDPNDPLDRMILQELNGEPVLFDTFLDAMDELAEEPDCAQILQERGLCAEEVLKEAEAYQEDFYRRLSERKLSIEDRFELCAGLASQAQENPSPELRRFYCEILCDPGFLLDHQPQFEDAEDELDHQEQTILQYLHFEPERDKLLKTLAQRQDLSEKFAEVTKQNRNPQPVDCDTKRSYEIAECFAELFEIPKKGNVDILLANLSNYIQIAAASSVLKAIEPLFLFRLLTRHQSRMCTVPDLNVNLLALWKRDNNKIDHDNGRNFKKYRLELSLFERLCHIYQSNETIDFPLCWYGLDQVTVLGDFYRQEINIGWTCVGSEDPYQFIPVIAEVVEDALFTCFETYSSGNVMLADSDITYEELEKFKQSEHPLIFDAFEKIYDCINDGMPELAFQSAKADVTETRALCQNILEQAKFKYQLSSPRETGLFLAFINDGFMQCQDWIANFFLAQAGHALLHEPIPQIPGLPE